MDQDNKKNCDSPINKNKQGTSNFNHRLDIAMKMKGYRSLNSFGKDLGYRGEFISMIINGKYKPTLETAQKIANYLGLKVQDIFDLASEVQIPNFFGKEEENE